MTAWQSMFDGGACEVEVDYQSTQKWRGALTKDSVSPDFDVNGDTFDVGVDPTGTVYLESETGSALGMGVMVYPQYDTSALSTQVIDIGTSPAPLNASGDAECDDATQTVELSFYGDPYNPDSATFTPHQPDDGDAARVGVRVASPA